MMPGISRPFGARRLVLAVLVLLCALAVPARAQFFAFGQNKIQYRKLDWRVMKGPHVDLYYYSAEADLAPAALAYAEASYDTLSVQFGHTVASRIPLIVYASHTDFEQTNILPFTPPEGLLGATDFLKRRVALPFRGNFAEFRHTMRHEMVHVFQLDMLVESYNLAPRARRFDFPLWWSEGLAELWSAGQDARDEMVMRDLTLSGRLPPFKQLTYVTGGIVYPIGGQIHRWLADTYGDWRAALMYKELNRHESFEAAIQTVYGRTHRPAQRRVPARHAASVLSVGRHPGAAAAARDRGRAAGREGRGHRRDGARYERRGVARTDRLRDAGQRVRVDLPEVARAEVQGALDRDRRPEGGDRVVPRVRFAHGRVPPGPAAVHRPLRRPRRALRLGSEAAESDGPVPVPGAGVAPLAPLDAGRPEHRRERPVAARRLGSLPYHPCPGASSRRSPTITTRTSTPAPAPTGAGWCSPPTGPPTGVAAPRICSCSTSPPVPRPSSPPATGGTSPRCGRPTVASISPPTATACSTSSPSIPPARAAARPPPGPVPSTPSRCPKAAWWSAGSTT